MRISILLLATVAAYGQPQRAVLLGIDGLGSKGLASAQTPNIDSPASPGRPGLFTRAG